MAEVTLATFSTTISAAGGTLAVTFAVLFSGYGSNSDATTWTLFTNSPVAFTSKVTFRVADEPLASEPTTQRHASGSHTPCDATCEMCTSPAGGDSVKVTPVALSGPLLVTVM